jgi:hypothetical protein
LKENKNIPQPLNSVKKSPRLYSIQTALDSTLEFAAEPSTMDVPAISVSKRPAENVAENCEANMKFLPDESLLTLKARLSKLKEEDAERRAGRTKSSPADS